MMKILFLYAGAESLGIEYLSACLKQKGHDTALVFDPALFNDKYFLSIPSLGSLLNKKRTIFEKISSAKADLIAFSVVKDLYLWATELSREIKKNSNTPIVFGGIHPTSVPDEVISDSSVDYLILGEGEQAFVELVDALENSSPLHNIKNLWFKNGGHIIKNPVRPLIQNLDEIPFPDKELFRRNIPINDSYLIMTSRGCPFQCTFCCNSILRNLYTGKGKWLRRRSMENVMEELVSMKKRFDFREVVFADDIFTVSLPWLENFFKEYTAKINLPFRCLSHPQFFSRDTALLLKASHCVRVRLSGQTMNERTRRMFLDRSETSEDIIRSFKICDEVGLPYTTDHILGIPEESEDQFLEAASIYNQTRCLAKIKCYYLDYFPGTKIVDIASRQGILSDGDVQKINRGHSKMYFEPNLLLERDRNLWNTARDFERYFKLLPILPLFIRKLILKKRIYRLFHNIPKFIFLLIDLLVGIMRRDTSAIPYFKYYVKNLFFYF